MMAELNKLLAENHKNLVNPPNLTVFTEQTERIYGTTLFLNFL